MRPVVTLVLVVAVTTPLIPDVRGESFRSASTKQAADDFYYHRDERVRLARSPGEVVVRFRTESEPDQQGVVRALGPGARLGPRVLSEGRAFQLVVLPSGADVVSALAQLQARDQVDFAAPVYYHVATRTRLAPTDEVIVKLKRGTSRDQVDDLLAKRGAAIVREMVGSADEYVVRLRGRADPLAEARALYESGRFEWVEPDFVHDIQKLQQLQ